MRFKKTSLLICTLIGILALTASSIRQKSAFKNLQVLPADISEQKLDSIMQSYNKALHVSCDFCHTKSQDSIRLKGDAAELTFELDTEMKENARRMIFMMNEINRTYFYFDKNIRPEYLNAVSCNTCHRGNPFPLGE